MPRPPLPWVVSFVLWAADWLIWFMLRPRSDERLVRPTMRVPWPKELKQELIRQQHGICAYCGTDNRLEIEHMVPLKRGGSNDSGNLQVACRQCNKRKGIQTDEEFRHRYSALIPSEPRTPPGRSYLKMNSGTLTQHTKESDTVRKFRKSRFYTKRTKVSTGCIIVFALSAYITVLPLHYWGITGLNLSVPPVVMAEL